MDYSQPGPSKMNITITKERLATPRELFYGVRTDGTILSSCTALEINCRQQITPKQFQLCAEHFNKNVPCFNEYITEEGKFNDFWLASKDPSFTVEELFDTDRSVDHIMEEFTNSPRTAEKVNASWELHYMYEGLGDEAQDDDIPDITSEYPHFYLLVFLFNTGTLDDYSCALVCNLFLNTLDCVVKDVQMPTYLGILLYDFGFLIRKIMYNEKKTVLNHVKEEKNFLSSPHLFQSNIGNFCFSSSKDDVETPVYKTHHVLLSEPSTTGFIEYCEDLKISPYCCIVALFNCIILRNAIESGYVEQKILIKILHNVNTKYINSALDKKCWHQVGSHMLPFLHYMMVESTDMETVIDEANLIEDFLAKSLRPSIYFQEIIREMVIADAKSNYKSGSWNPNYFYSMTNLGNLDLIYTEDKLNSFYTSGYFRSKTSQETGCMDIAFYIFKGQLNFSVDYSTRDVSESEIEDVFNLFAASFDFIE